MARGRALLCVCSGTNAASESALATQILRQLGGSASLADQDCVPRKHDTLIVLIAPAGHFSPEVIRIVRAAFESGARIIPALMYGAQMPDERELPADISPIARINAIAIASQQVSDAARQVVAHIRREIVLHEPRTPTEFLGDVLDDSPARIRVAVVCTAIGAIALWAIARFVFGAERASLLFGNAFIFSVLVLAVPAIAVVRLGIVGLIWAAALLLTPLACCLSSALVATSAWPGLQYRLQAKQSEIETAVSVVVLFFPMFSMWGYVECRRRGERRLPRVMMALAAGVIGSFATAAIGLLSGPVPFAKDGKGVDVHAPTTWAFDLAAVCSITAFAVWVGIFTGLCVAVFSVAAERRT